MDNNEIAEEFYSKLTEELGSSVSEVSEDAFHLMGAIAQNLKCDIYKDGGLYDFLSCTFEPDEPIWDFVTAVEDE